MRRVALIASHADAGRRPDVPAARRRRRAAVLDGAGPPTGGDPARFAEDVKFRGLHPMIARRLQMWRLANFEIRRLPAAGDVYLFDCVGPGEPSDERLVAVAEVRDLTPSARRARPGVAVPEVEILLVAALDAIRQARAARPRRRQLEWNRIMLYVWPPIDLPLDELTEVARRLVPLTEGLGLEQIVVSGRFAGLGADEPVETVMRLGYEAGRGLRCGSPRRRPRRCSRSTTTPASSSRPAGAGSSTPTSWCRC